MTTPTQTPELLTLEEAAQLLRRGKSTIRLYVKRGRITGYQVAGSGPLLFRREDLLGVLTPVPVAEETQSHIDPADLDPGERADTIAGVKRGLKAAQEGRIRPWREFAAEMRAKYGIPE